MAGMTGNCIMIGNTVSSICTKAAGMMCMYESPYTDIVPVPAQHRTFSGTVSTNNIIMANWPIQMWRSVMNRAARSLANRPFEQHFIAASVTVSG
ncbi:hypothetical protein KIN20_008738 [Parelaphostrongylus tenuis]|uniref:Uncharacterized protein n=1 Tax=Parelaphostrongylus tenuis TaxID=148309 RepID=A0AAD5M578_PARTN|nr:hypothetical protein KIN20_008738 [Parelaphostrongylus tenuis]